MLKIIVGSNAQDLEDKFNAWAVENPVKVQNITHVECATCTGNAIYIFVFYKAPK